MCKRSISFYFFFFNDTATTEIYTLSLHDALPIYQPQGIHPRDPAAGLYPVQRVPARPLHLPILRQAVRHADRKSTRLNSSHSQISYAVFCLKKKNLNHNWSRVVLYDALPTYYTIN